MTEYVAPAPAVTHAPLFPATEHVAPHLPLPTYDEPAAVVEYVPSAPVVFYAAPAPLIECSAVYKDEYDLTSNLFLLFDFSCFQKKLPDTRIILNFQNYQ